MTVHYVGDGCNPPHQLVQQPWTPTPSKPTSTFAHVGMGCLAACVVGFLLLLVIGAIAGSPTQVTTNCSSGSGYSVSCTTRELP